MSPAAGARSRPLLLSLALGVLAAGLNAGGAPVTGRTWLCLGGGPALLALALAGFPAGLLAVALAAAGLWLAGVGQLGLLAHAGDLIAVAWLARRAGSQLLAGAIYWASLGAVLRWTRIESVSGDLATAVVGGLLAAGLAEAALLAARALGAQPREGDVSLWADALPGAMLVVVGPSLLASLAWTRGVPTPAGALAPVLAGLLAALALALAVRRVAATLDSVTAAAGDAASGVSRGPHPISTLRVAAIREVRGVAKALNDLHDSLAFYDATTRLPNQRLLQDRLGLAVAQGARSRQGFALLLVDLDRFRSVDASLGREAADGVLGLLARRLEECVRPGDTLARIGGDEFALLLPGFGTLEEASEIGLRVMEAVRQPLAAGGREVFVTASVGISLFPRDGGSAEELLKNATAATYAAKEKGQDSLRRYTSRLSAKDTKRVLVETGLRHALEAGELVLHYQPIVRVSSGRIEAAEALLRWQKSDGSLIAPGEFLPLVESSGLMASIDSWALRAACVDMAGIGRRGHAVSVSVNVSARQFQQSELVAQVREALSASGLPARSLGIEITEGTAMQDVDRSIETLQQLRALGIKVSVDDFGTGYSSLSYLQRLPIDTVKLDRAFVRELETDRESAAIASAVIAMAHSLELDVVAEGVEKVGQLRYLEAQGCEAIQGFLVSPGVPIEDLAALLRREGSLLPAY